MHILKKINQNQVYEYQSIDVALKKMEKSLIKILFVIDKKKKLVGSITDGDIRRFLIKKKVLKGNVNQFMNKNFSYAFNDSSKKLNNALMKKKDLKYIPILNKKKRLVKIQTTERLFDEKFNKIVLMAGGKGTRLRPLTKNIPKPLIKINDIPLIESLILKFINQGFNKFIISVNYLGKKIEKYLGNGKKFGCNIKYVKEKKYLGTAGSLSLIKNMKFKKPLLVMNSDIVTNIDFDSLISYHKTHKADLTICAKNYRNVSLYGELSTKNYKVISIKEKPIKDVFVNLGIYVINPNILKFVEKRELHMTDLINFLINKKKKIFYYPTFENWIDIGNKKDLQKLIKK
tara:strand:- start:344 stop:1378 length:1035 start_codon:yes stop_codon:yes gene_type:complete